MSNVFFFIRLTQIAIISLTNGRMRINCCNSFGMEACAREKKASRSNEKMNCIQFKCSTWRKLINCRSTAINNPPTHTRHEKRHLLLCGNAFDWFKQMFLMCMRFMHKQIHIDFNCVLYDSLFINFAYHFACKCNVWVSVYTSWCVLRAVYHPFALYFIAFVYYFDA